MTADSHLAMHDKAFYKEHHGVLLDNSSARHILSYTTQPGYHNKTECLHGCTDIEISCFELLRTNLDVCRGN